jgi:NAD(P)-dependent dehydrogenase (short-subunit alcohol dehydrogenase family)
MFNCTRAAWPRMKAQGGGHVIGIASGSSVRGYREEIAYCAVKHGVEGFVKALSSRPGPTTSQSTRSGRASPLESTTGVREEQLARDAGHEPRHAVPQAANRAAAQPPARFSGHRFDAAPLVDTIAREGEDFEFAPEKVTAYPDDFRARQHWYEHYTG